MNNEKEQILTKALNYLNEYKDESVYYKELKRAYEEYQTLVTNDPVTNELFVKHINDLCDFLKKRKNANTTITCLVFFIILIVALTSFTAVKYYNLSSDLKRNIVNHNGSTSLNVQFNNPERFEANKLSDMANYMSLDPLTFTILVTNKNDLDLKVHYDVYLIEENSEVIEDNLISRDAFVYYINSSNRESGIKTLKDTTEVKGKLLLFSGEVNTNKEELVSLRMWIDSNTNVDYLNKKYKFKLYVDGYVI